MSSAAQSRFDLSTNIVPSTIARAFLVSTLIGTVLVVLIGGLRGVT
jgi:hypothetical protein